MNWQQIINRALRLSHTNNADYTTAQAVEDLNLVYQDLVDRIVCVSKWDYFWDIWTTSTIVNQSEYLAESLWIAPDDLDIKKINKVFIKYNSNDEYFTKALYQNPGTLAEHPDYYKANQSKTNPFFYIQDNSFFIYPAPDTAVSWGIEIFVIHKPADIDETTTEDNIEIPAQFHKVISDWLKMYVYQSQGKLNEAQLAEQDYEKGIANMVSFIKQRYNQPIKKTMSNLTSFR